jgi:hypothetical protein
MTPNIMFSWRVKYKRNGSIMTANPILTYAADTPGAIEEATKKKYGSDCTLLSYERNR